MPAAGKKFPLLVFSHFLASFLDDTAQCAFPPFLNLNPARQFKHETYYRCGKKARITEKYRARREDTSWLCRDRFVQGPARDENKSVQSSGFRVQGSEFRVQGSEFSEKHVE